MYSSEASSLFRNAYNSGNFAQALLQARRHFTWYALAHKAHTVPLLRANHDAGQELLDIDIGALTELLENIHLCYHHLGRGEEFLNVIDATTYVVNHERWIGKSAYMRGLWYVEYKNDEATAYQALKDINIGACNDADILALYLQVAPRQIAFTEYIGIINRIINSTPKESVRLQYRILKAIKYHLICQPEEGDKIFEEALSIFRSLPEDKKTLYGRFQFVHALELYGAAEGRTEVLQEGRAAVIELIKHADDQFSREYFSQLYKLLGDYEAALENSVGAEKAYTKSLKIFSADLTKIFLARAIKSSGDGERARKLLNSIDETSLKEPGRFDLAISWALLAATSLDRRDLDEAKKRLKFVKAHDPLFIQLRDRWMIDLLEAEAIPSRGSNTLRKLVHSLNRYVTLNPNFFGIGVNLNRIIDDVERKNES
ncbi:hypothetical protein [Halomonas sp. RT37]|uniref:Tetratricopeptide repeat protein n=1 Tax=Halomonas sp. RT37 TaxID=2950872 RepID=A0AAU7KKD4_9GAMM